MNWIDNFNQDLLEFLREDDVIPNGYSIYEIQTRESTKKCAEGTCDLTYFPLTIWVINVWKTNCKIIESDYDFAEFMQWVTNKARSIKET